MDANVGGGTHVLSGGTLRLTGSSYAKDWTLANGTTSNRIESTRNGAIFAGDITFASGPADVTALTLATTNLSTRLLVSGNIRNASGGNLSIDPDSYVVLQGADNGYTGETPVGESATLEHEAAFVKDPAATHDLSGGTLNVNGEATYDGNLEAEGAAVNFKMSGDYQPSSSALLTVTGDANLVDATLTASVVGISAAVRTGDELKLFEVTGDLWTDGLKTATLDDQGLLAIKLGELDTAGGTVKAKVLSVSVDEKAKAYAEGFLGGAAALVGAADFATQQGLDSARKSVLAAGGAGPIGFASVGGGSLKYKTGSHVDADGYNLLGGVASGSRFAAGQLTVGAFVEYGEGDYSTYNSFATGKVKGKGDTEYRGAGLLAQFAFDNGFYLDGSLRAGKVDNDFRSADINGSRTAYDVSSRYHGAHAGVGRVWQSGAGSLDVSAQYLWTHQKGDTARLKGASTTRLDFDGVDSSRVRLGACYTRVLGRSTSGYVGAAWEKEFDGQAKSTLNGREIDTPELKGDTGRVELGLTTTPFANTPLTLDVGVQGYWGQREGLTGSAKLNYRF